MPRPLQLLLVVLAPVAVFAGLIAADRLVDAPGRRGQVLVRIELAPAGGEIGLPPIEEPVDWPPVGFVEAPAQFAQGETPLSYLSPVETDVEELAYEDAA